MAQKKHKVVLPPNPVAPPNPPVAPLNLPVVPSNPRPPVTPPNNYVRNFLGKI